MRTEKKRAIQLRLSGKSYTQIQKTLGVPKATLSSWLKKVPLSPVAKTRLSDHTKTQRHQNITALNHRKTRDALTRSHVLRATASHTIGKLSFRELLIAGGLIYWMQGYKKPVVHKGKLKTYHSTRITSTQPDIVALFVRFAKDIGGIASDKLRVVIRIHSSQDLAKTLHFWTKLLRLSPMNIHVAYYKASSKASHYALHPYGAAQVIINDTSLYHTVMGFIDGLGQTS